MPLPDGRMWWFVTGFDEVCVVLGDPRFHVLANPADGLAEMSPQTAAEFRKRPLPGALARSNPPEHTAYRRQLIPHFSQRRLKVLAERIDQVTSDLLERMAAKGPPADLVADFAVPVPSIVICELLGMPYAQSQRFHTLATAALRLDSSPEDQLMLGDQMLALVQDVVRHKKDRPNDGLLAELLTPDDPREAASEEEVTCRGVELLIAGYETTANMIALGTFALLEHPEQLAALRARPELIGDAVEELLRYLSVIHVGPARRAVQDVQLGAHLIRAGESVIVSLPEANRNAERFPDPHRLDITRDAAGHLAFGHGRHLCLGHQLARIELTIAFTALLERFPTLRLAIPAADVPLRTDMSIYGLHRLPVTWDTPTTTSRS